MTTFREEYRTFDQWEEIAESMINGNWTQAGNECVDGGFYAHDLIEHWKEDSCGVEMEDLVYLIEIATKLRYQDD